MPLNLLEECAYIELCILVLPASITPVFLFLCRVVGVQRNQPMPQIIQSEKQRKRNLNIKEPKPSLR